MLRPRLALSLLVAALCALACSPGAGIDAGVSPDAGEGPSCRFFGESCASAAACCGELTCRGTGVCGHPPRCEGDDAIAGGPTTPTPLEQLQAGDTMLACPGREGMDVFSVTAQEGEVLRFTLFTEGLAQGAAVGAGEPDLDLTLLSGPPTDVKDGVVQGPTVATAASERAREVLRYEVPADGTYYLVVTLWSGPDGAYRLELERTRTCAFDADCSAGELCRVARDFDAGATVRECAVHAAPACGRGPAGAGSSDTSALLVDGLVTGLACAGDIDVFALDKSLGAALFLEVGAELAPGETVYLTMVQPSGAIAGTFALAAGRPSRGLAIPPAGAPGRWLAYVEAVGASDDVSYRLDVQARSACRSDGDCDEAQACGYLSPFVGYYAVCAPPVATPCHEGGAGERRSTARLLDVDAPLSAEVCAGGLDHARVSLDAPSSDVTLRLAWEAEADLDLYVYAGDGTSLGAALYGEPEVWRGRALPPQDLLLIVHSRCPTGASCEQRVPYTLALQLDPPTPCDGVGQCVVGGTTSASSHNDPARALACAPAPLPPLPSDAGVTDGGDAEEDAGEGERADDAGAGQVCVRPAPAGLFDRPGGASCYEADDCAGGRCVAGTCTLSCAGDDACDEAFGAGVAYCHLGTSAPFCFSRCEETSDCLGVFGQSASVECQAGRCAPTG
jgi:hypothetical protein